MTAPLQINFGQPSPDQVVGRSTDLDKIRVAIRRGSSVILSGERRIGKSWVLKALAASPPTGWTVIYTDVEQILDLDNLHDVLVERITQHLPRSRRLVERILNSGIKEVKGIPIPQGPSLRPVDRLRRLIRGVSADGRRLVLVLDELPILAQRLESRSPGDAVELLQLLRALRMEEANVRMVLAGSIGFHHLLAEDAEIKAAVNDLLPVPIGPITRADAVDLARRLLAGISLAADTGVAEAIADATDCVPFYIQHLVAHLEGRLAGKAATVADVTAARRHALAAPDDPWRMRHYDERIDEYFAGLSPVARAALTAVASADQPMPFADIVSRVLTDRRVNRITPAVDDEIIRRVLDRLTLDHYLVIDEHTLAFTFCFDVVRDAWRTMHLR